MRRTLSFPTGHLREEEISRHVIQYYETIASDYDRTDLESAKRNAFTEGIDRIVAGGLKGARPSPRILSIGCGTGRRERRISDWTGLVLPVVGVDSSETMCRQARQGGLDVVYAAWPAAVFAPRTFGATLCLFSFGVVPSRAGRMEFLGRVFDALAVGGDLYVDVLNVEAVDGWAPQLRELHASGAMWSGGVEYGDAMFCANERGPISYFHYFSAAEIVSLLEAAGFELATMDYVGHDTCPGKLTTDQRAGAILLRARRPA